MEIRIKPIVVRSSDGFDFFKRPVTYREVKQKVLGYGAYNSDHKFFYHIEKRRRKVSVTPRTTPSGKPSKKAPLVVVTPTHWRYRIYAVPLIVLDLLKRDGKKIVQHARHWEIVDGKK